MPTNDPVHILGIGYLLPVKRWERLLAAVHKLKQNGFNFLVQIAGNGPLRPELEDKAIALGIADRIQFMGHVADVSNQLAQAAFVVHTADSEGCPNAITEAMACGRAVVATDAGDIASLIENGTTGYVVPRDDTEALVDRMGRLINDLNLCKIMGKAGRAKAEREFRLDRLVEETLAVYRSAGWQDDCVL